MAKKYVRRQVLYRAATENSTLTFYFQGAGLGIRTMEKYGGADYSTTWRVRKSERHDIWVLEATEATTGVYGKITRTERAGRTLQEAMEHMIKRIIAPYQANPEASPVQADELETALRRHLQGAG